MKRLVADQGDLTLVYVNQWGGQDELVFDGHSFVARGGRLLYAAQQVEADEFPVVDLSAVVDDTTQQERVPPEVSLRRLIVMSLRDYALKSGFRDAVVASSGGIDSALTIALACDALGPSHVHAIRMPSIFSSEHSKTDAKALHEALGCWDYEVPIEHLDLVASLNERFDHLHDPDHLVRRVWAENKYNSVADQNLQARLRDVYLMHFSNAFGALPLATGNKTESACGYFTHFDMNLSFAPIMDLYKRQVFELAEQHPAIPRSIIEKRPSAELAPNQFDEESLLPYAILDPIVQGYVEEFKSDFNAFRHWVTTVDQVISSDRDALLTWLNEEDSEAAYTRIIGLIGRMEFKRRQTCPGPKLSKVAFGIGRRVPIVKAFR
jgi:NAD+ synthase (glutamine-hydrolysing)